MEDYEDNYEHISFTEETWTTEFELHMKMLHYFDISRIVVFTITAIVGIIGNGLVIWITGFKMKSVSSVWFLNLAVADFISCFFLFLYVAEWSSPILDTQSLMLCLIRFFMLSLNMLTSVYFLMVISLDRCVSTMWPLWTRIHRKIKPARVISVIIWVFCLVSGFLYEVYHLEGLFGYECIVKRYLIGSENLEQPREKHIVRIIVMFVLPFTIILVSYSLVAFKIRARKRWHKSNRPFKVILALVICFFVCWFPFHMTFVTPNIDKTGESPWKNVIKEEICLCLAYFNSCVNPIIYVLLSSDVKGLTLRNKMVSAMTAQYDLDDNEEISNRLERARKEDSSAL